MQFTDTKGVTYTLTRNDGKIFLTKTTLLSPNQALSLFEKEGVHRRVCVSQNEITKIEDFDWRLEHFHFLMKTIPEGEMLCLYYRQEKNTLFEVHYLETELGYLVQTKDYVNGFFKETTERVRRIVR